MLHVKYNNKLHKCNIEESLPLEVIPDLFSSLILVLREIKDLSKHCCLHGCHERGHQWGTLFDLIFCSCFLTKEGYCVIVEGIIVTIKLETGSHFRCGEEVHYSDLHDVSRVHLCFQPRFKPVVHCKSPE